MAVGLGKSGNPRLGFSVYGLLIVCSTGAVCGATCLPNFITTWQTVVAFVVGSSRVLLLCLLTDCSYNQFILRPCCRIDSPGHTFTYLVSW